MPDIPVGVEDSFAWRPAADRLILEQRSVRLLLERRVVCTNGDD